MTEPSAEALAMVRRLRHADSLRDLPGSGQEIRYAFNDREAALEIHLFADAAYRRGIEDTLACLGLSAEFAEALRAEMAIAPPQEGS
jgi:hypothetical protein